MYPSGFYQPFCHAGQPSKRDRNSQPSYVLSAEPVYRAAPSIFDLQQLVSQQHRQRRAAQIAAQQEHERELRIQRERDYQRHIALKQERARAIEQERRRRLLARREYERQLAVEEEKQVALRAYHHAQQRARHLERQRVEEEQRREYEEAVNARRAYAQRQEEVSFAALVNSLFQFEPRTDEQEELSGSPTEYMDENVRAGEFEESSEEEDDDDEPLEMGSLLNSLFRGMGVSTEATQTTVNDLSKKQEPSSTPPAKEPEVASDLNAAAAADYVDNEKEASTFADIQQRYEQHQTRVQRLEILEALDARLERLTSSFSFPSTLDFQWIATSDTSEPLDTATVPQLEYTTTNTPYHAHAHALLALLVDADAVASDGDEEVRARRKEFVMRVEKELDGLEREKARVWRERGDSGR